MPKHCPACGRPNGDQARRCLYCSCELADVLAEEKPSTGTGKATERHLVILLPQQNEDPQRLRPFAEAFGLSDYDARLALATDRARLIRRVEDLDAARRLSGELSTVAIAHYVVSERQVESTTITPIRRLMLDDKLSFVTEAKQWHIAYEDLLLVVVGEIQRERYQEGLIASSKGASAPLTPGSRVHLFTRDSQTAIEIDPESFDWARTLDDASAAAVVNQQKLLDFLETKNPSLEIDRDFNWETPVTARVDSGSDLSSMLTERDAKNRGQVHDNSAQFHFYSRWRYRLAKHLASRE